MGFRLALRKFLVETRPRPRTRQLRTLDELAVWRCQQERLPSEHGDAKPQSKYRIYRYLKSSSMSLAPCGRLDAQDGYLTDSEEARCHAD